MIKYFFKTVWHFDAPPEKVWELIKDARSMPEWWPGVKRFEILSKERELQPSCLIQASVKGLTGDLNFELEVSKAVPCHEIVMLSRGDLMGQGVWTLTPDNGKTISTYIWEVTTTGKLMNAIGSVCKPVFIWNHNRVMTAGFKALKKRL
ncbi:MULTISPECIES: SRPBCC family protein [Dehalococcoides]|uniref:SRPBCC family protein n=1 Tax=Dehalococcoides TaxID=61434 RepID=UPI0009953558|nr:SRPBCC family protein [Dehalococcoides mccartyi]AQW62894.1 cyclase [Dehalococcoides mccartyi]